MHEHEPLPRARKDGLLEETVGEELLLYDQDSHTAHCLSPIAACIWRHCDGELDVTELAELAGASESLVADALHELREKDLLAAEPGLTQSTVLGISRREAIGRVARYGAAAAAVPLVVSATAATPAMASSPEKGEGPCEAGTSTCCLCKEKNMCTTGYPTEKECAEGYCSLYGGVKEFKEKSQCKKA
jgi:hypothetical protein